MGNQLLDFAYRIRGIYIATLISGATGYFGRAFINRGIKSLNFLTMEAWTIILGGAVAFVLGVLVWLKWSRSHVQRNPQQQYNQNPNPNR